MKKFAVLLDNIVQFIYSSEESFNYPSPFVEIDITDYKGEVGDFYVYDVETGEFTKGEVPSPPPVPTPAPSAEEVQFQTLLNTEFLITMSEISSK